MLPKSKVSPLATRIQGALLPALLVLTALPLASHAQSLWSITDGSWSTATNWTPNGVPISTPTTQLIFEASDATSYTTTNNIGAATFNLNRITANNTGTGTITIAGASTANTLTFGGTNPTLDITGNVVFSGLMVGAPTITKTGTGTFIHDSNNALFTGTIIVDQGTFVNRSTLVATTNFNPVSIVVNNGGTYQFGDNGVGNPNVPNSTYITVNTGGTVSWQEGEDFGGFHLQGGTINLQAGANCLGSSVQNWTSGTLTGGAFAIAGNTAVNKITAGTVNITGSASITAGTGGLNILQGTVAMANAANLGAANVSLGDTGGTTTGTFDYQGGSATRGGDFNVNDGDGVINVASATTVLNLNGSFSGTGDLTKTGAGKLRLSGFLNNSGATNVVAGTLQVEPSVAFGGFSVASGAVLAINSGLGIGGFSVPTVNLASGTSTLEFNLDTIAVTAVPLLAIATFDGLTFTGTPTLKVTNLQPFALGTYTLVDYDGSAIAAGFNLALPGRTAGNLIYDTTNTKIDLGISGTDTVKWTGATNGNWEVGTAAGVGGTNNWRLVTAGTSTNFIDTDSITFDDTATNRTVNLSTTVQPATITVNAAADYTFSGPGKLSGPTALNKSGPGTLILATDNDYFGGTNVTGGSVQLGNGGTTGSVLGSVSLNGGTLAFNRSDSFTFGNAISFDGTAGITQNGTGTVTIGTAFATLVNTVTIGGTGNLALAATLSGAGILNKEGAGTLTLQANNNAFTGALNINSGTVLLTDFGSGGDLGASSIVVNNGGTFILGADGNADLPDTTLITINSGGLFQTGQGENFAGFVLDGGEVRYVSTANTGVNTTGITTLAGTTVYDLRSGAITTDITTPGTGGGLNQGGGGVLTKTTTGTVTVSGGVTFQASLAMQIKEGTLAMNLGNVPATGTAAMTLGDITTNGTLRVNGVGAATSFRPFTLEAGGGTFDLSDSGTSLAITGSVNGPGSLAKIGNGTLILVEANGFGGGTLVSAGVLEVNNFSGSGTGSGQVIVNGVLAGDGGIITGVGGNNIQLNGTFRPGITGGIQGTDFNLTAGVGATTIFGATSIASFDLWSTAGVDQSFNPAAADLLLIAGDFSIASGAILTLTNPNALTFQDGDGFRLFDWTGVGTLSGTWTVDSTALNLGSLMLDTSGLYTSGTIRVTSVPEPSTALLMVLGISTFVLRRHRTARAVVRS